jgi:hypothetical protein
MKSGIAAPPATELFLPFRKTISGSSGFAVARFGRGASKNPFFIPAAGAYFLVALAGGFAEGPEPEGADDARAAPVDADPLGALESARAALTRSATRRRKFNASSCAAALSRGGGSSSLSESLAPAGAAAAGASTRAGGSSSISSRTAILARSRVAGKQPAVVSMKQSRFRFVSARAVARKQC